MADRGNDPQRHHLPRQQPRRPAPAAGRWRTQPQCDQLGLLLAVQQIRHRRAATLLAWQCQLKAPQHAPSAPVLDGLDTAAEGVSDPPVRPRRLPLALRVGGLGFLPTLRAVPAQGAALAAGTPFANRSAHAAASLGIAGHTRTPPAHRLGRAAAGAQLGRLQPVAGYFAAAAEDRSLFTFSRVPIHETDTTIAMANCTVSR